MNYLFMNKWCKNHINFWLAYNDDDDVAAVEEIFRRMRMLTAWMLRTRMMIVMEWGKSQIKPNKYQKSVTIFTATIRIFGATYHEDEFTAWHVKCHINFMLLIIINSWCILVVNFQIWYDWFSAQDTLGYSQTRPSSI